MRLWSIHPKYLDSKGLVALWRETLLAQKVLKGNTKGYKNHPQLIRFKKHKQTNIAISQYLYDIYIESMKRNYNFNKNKIDKLSEIDNYTKNVKNKTKLIPVTIGQIDYEFKHLRDKLKERDITFYKKIENIKKPDIHPLFKLIKGEVEKWEK
ncbi:MAG: pyrimidine dimer DNA glycosylase/endonuclease V [bacterium]